MLKFILPLLLFSNASATEITCSANCSTSTVGGYTVMKVTGDTDLSVTCSDSPMAVLAVGGGGTGAARATYSKGGKSFSYNGGGGGGGGVNYVESITIPDGSYHVVTGNPSGNTSFHSITAYAGGNGGKGNVNPTGMNGGSGGGSVCSDTGVSSGVSGQGNAGGSTSDGLYEFSTTCGSGGGGGATSAGGSSSTSGNVAAAGAGYTSSIDGTSRVYGQGGKGGEFDGFFTTPLANQGWGGDGNNRTSVAGDHAGSGGVLVLKYTPGCTPPPSSYVTCSTGCAVSSSGGYTILKATGSTSITISKIGYIAEVLVVGAGGSAQGGIDNKATGGGGAGGYRHVLNKYVTPGTYPVIVGLPEWNGATSPWQSSFDNIISWMGGLGSEFSGGEGGSGGGSSCHLGGGSAGIGYAGQGTNGSIGYGDGNNDLGPCSSGGGGGSGSAGGGTSSVSVPGAGGSGTVNDITGSSVTYAAGGAGNTSTGTDSVSGAANTGNGASGSGGANKNFGYGGSGVVILKLRDADFITTRVNDQGLFGFFYP